MIKKWLATIIQGVQATFFTRLSSAGRFASLNI